MKITELVRATLEVGGVVPHWIVLISKPFDTVLSLSAIDTRIQYLLYIIFVVVVVYASAREALLVLA